MHLRRCGAAFATLALTSSLAAFGGAAASPSGHPAAERWIVQLRPGTDASSVAAEHSRAYGARTGHVYEHALQGYSAIMSAQAAARVASDPRVDHVERDQLVAAFGIPTGVDRIADPDTNNATIEGLTIDGRDDKRIDVDVAVIDTGVDASHFDLDVEAGVDCTGSPWNDKCGAVTPNDQNGHGTHVAGTIGALDNGAGVVGVAPGARIWSVRVLNGAGSGYMSWIVAGIDWVAGKQSVEVANMSLGCECDSQALDDAITSAVRSGVTFVVAAGNSGKDASTFSPANHADVITVSALADGDGRSGGSGTAAITCRSGETDDRLATFSNYGSSVEVTAPGVCITSTWPGGGLNTISGTSMASPHVAGAAALLMSGSSSLTPSQVRQQLVATGDSLDWIDTSDFVEEPRVDVSAVTPATVAGSESGGDGGGTTPTNQPPTVSITSTSCTGATCSFAASGSDPDNGPSALSYSWAFGDGGTASGASVTHRFGGSGRTTYTVRVTVSDGAAQAAATTTVSCTGKGKTRSCS